MGGKDSTITTSSATGHAPGWSGEETAYRQRDGSTLWQVEANCREHRILVWGRTRSEAWKAASRMANRIQPEP